MDDKDGLTAASVKPTFDIAVLVLGIISLVSSCLVIGIIPAIIAIILGIISIKRGNSTMKIKAGMICALIAVVLTLIASIVGGSMIYKEFKIDNLIKAGQYDEALRYIEDNPVSATDSQRYDALIGLGRYDDAANIYIDSANKASDDQEIIANAEKYKEKIDPIYDKVSDTYKEKIDAYYKRIEDAKARIAEAEKKAEEERQAEEERKAEEMRQAEEAKKAEAAKKEDEARQAEEAEKIAGEKDAAKKTAKEEEKNDASRTVPNDDDTPLKTVIARPDKYSSIHQWITDHKGSPEKVKEKHIKKVKKMSDEGGFFFVWRSYINESLRLYDENYYWQGDIMHFVQLYRLVWPDASMAKEIDEIEQCARTMDTDYARIEELRNKYPFDADNELAVGIFYISQRLEKGYSDNLLGKLQKEVESYKPVVSSDWIAYDLLDNCCIIHADYANPFENEGNYNLYYVETGDTMSLTDAKGFTQAVPIYFLIPDETQGKKELQELKDLKKEYLNTVDKLKELLKE